MVDVLINDFIDGAGACYVAYVESTNNAVLGRRCRRRGRPLRGSMVLNGSGFIENSQCRVDGAGSSPRTAATTSH
jgi:hypothetical protein